MDKKSNFLLRLPSLKGIEIYRILQQTWGECIFWLFKILLYIKNIISILYFIVKTCNFIVDDPVLLRIVIDHYFAKNVLHSNVY